MKFKTILGGTVALLLLAGPAPAQQGGLLSTLKADVGRSIPHIGLPKLFGGKAAQPQVQLAQAGDPRITALEERIRQLSGTIEELNFQVLQMQEQMRKMQEDNEFRFQEIEGGKKRTDAGAPAADAPEQQAAVAAPAAPSGSSTVEDIIIDNGTGEPAAVPSGTGAAPTTFGTITFDDKGNVVGGGVGDQIIAAPGAPTAGGPASDDTVVAALPSTDDPEELYRNSYEFILSGDYQTAETGFRDHIARFPANAKTADARFWLGESLLGQKRYRDAAETFLSANKDYPSSKKAPDMLLKLGVSLVGLDQKDVACATFTEVGKRYPDISAALKERVKREQAAASC